MTRLRRAPSVELERYLEQLAGPAPAGRLLEIRYVSRPGMARLFVPARRPDLARRAVLPLAERTDVYCGVLLRTRRAGGRGAVAASHLVWVDLDVPDAPQRLDRFPVSPSMTVLTGTPGHAHAYWTLTSPIGAETVEQVNRGLARELGGDPASVDRARILRPAGGRSHKHHPPALVRLAHLDGSCHDLAELVDALGGLGKTGANAPPTRSTRGITTRPLDMELRRIPTAEYVARLTGRVADRAGKVSCPFHEDRTPSLQLYDDGSWYCFGACRTGGSVFDFGARLFGLATRGREFVELRARLAAELLPTCANASLREGGNDTSGRLPGDTQAVATERPHLPALDRLTVSALTVREAQSDLLEVEPLDLGTTAAATAALEAERGPGPDDTSASGD